VFAAAALAVSLATFAMNYQWNRRAERRARMPVLVFRDRRESDVTVANVGKSAAMNIIFAQGSRVEPPGGAIDLDEDVREEWFSPIHLRPLEPNATVTVPCFVEYGLGLRYTDVFDAAYVVKATDYGMRIFEGKGHLPPWSMVDEARYLEELRPETLDGLCRGHASGKWAVRSFRGRGPARVQFRRRPSSAPAASAPGQDQ
jgi:hypothetical protein